MVDQWVMDDGQCEKCGFPTDGVKTCGFCGEPMCPVCGCYCFNSGDAWESMQEVEEEIPNFSQATKDMK